MIALKRKQVRPNKEVEFFTGEKYPDYVEHFIEKYVKPGKFLYSEKEFFNDELEVIITTIWDSKETLLEFKNDPVVMETLLKEKEKYIKDTGIIEELVSVETID